MTDQDWFTLDDTVADEVLRAATGSNGAQPDEPADSWTPINLTTLPDQPPVQPTLGGTSLIYPGKRHVFSGPPESAKTLAAYAILIRVARCRQTAILIDFEMGAYDARQRLYELGASRDELASIYFLEPAESATEARVEALVHLGASLVVVDAAAGAYALEGLDDNKRQDVEKVARLYVTSFWRAGIATIFIDHVVKDAEHRGRFAIGSERKLGGADVHFGFETISPISRGTAGRYKLVTHKDRAGYMKRGHVADMVLESDPGTHQIEWSFTAPQTIDETGYFRPTHLMEKVSVDLENRLEPVTRNTIHDALGGRKEFVLKAIDALVREGFLAEEDGPNRSRLVRSSREYRENDDVGPPENGSTIRPEPVPMFSSKTTGTTKNDLAQPCGFPVVPGGSRVVPGTTKRGGSQSPVLRTGDQDHATDHQEPGQWFRDLTNEHDDWVDSLEPELDE